MDRDQERVQRSWAKYGESRDEESRNDLMLLYAPLVKQVAGRMSMGMPSSVEYDDLLSYGAFGLLDALEKFDPSRGVKFETYASRRIRGAILDGLRAEDWVPRSVREKARKLELLIGELEGTLGRTPSEVEIAQALTLPLSKFHQMLEEVKTTSLLSLDLEISQRDKEGYVSLREAIEDGSPSIVEELENKETLQELAQAVDSLSEKERQVIALYYHEGLRLKEIAYCMQLTEARISQIHTKAILTLRSKVHWL